MKKYSHKIQMNGRREFIKKTSLFSLGFLALSKCAMADDLVPAFDSENLIKDTNGYLDLPEGFTYKMISKAGEVMDDGFYAPGRPDGMGAFVGPNKGEVILVRNHENSPDPLSNSPFGRDNELLSKLGASDLYDVGSRVQPSLGGTTTLIFNEDTQTVERQYLSLAGTNRNCAGGVTPWGSWLSCEEDVALKSRNAEKDHGFVFEVPAANEGLADPFPLRAMGRFNHEAVAVDPDTSIVYQTEDRPDGLIYRFVPWQKENLTSGGKLQVLAIENQKGLDTRNWKRRTVKLNEPMSVVWLDIDDVLSPNDDLRYLGFEIGAARFARGEGMWFGNGELYFACTNGGPRKYGQVFKYEPSLAGGNETDGSTSGTLELFAESEDRSVLHMCDNLTIYPSGTLFLCEDNGRLNHIRGIRPNGAPFTFATNRSSTSEFAGVVFSPSGKTLFVNIQENGDTLAITGPWENI